MNLLVHLAHFKITYHLIDIFDEGKFFSNKNVIESIIASMWTLHEMEKENIKISRQLWLHPWIISAVFTWNKIFIFPFTFIHGTFRSGNILYDPLRPTQMKIMFFVLFTCSCGIFLMREDIYWENYGQICISDYLCIQITMNYSPAIKFRHGFPS